MSMQLKSIGGLTLFLQVGFYFVYFYYSFKMPFTLKKNSNSILKYKNF